MSCMMTDGPAREPAAPLGVRLRVRAAGRRRGCVPRTHHDPVQRRALLAAGRDPTGGAGRCANRWAATGSLLPTPKLAGAAGRRRVPEIHFTLADGTPRTLADYAGKGVVLNLWATWCVPCVAEMPALATLAELVHGADVAVLPLSSDRGGAPAVEKFYREQGRRRACRCCWTRAGDAARALGARGIPTTVLIDRNGRERGRLEGGADWASDEAVARSVGSELGAVKRR